MPRKVTAGNCNKVCAPKDKTPPPTPQIRVSIASAGLCPDGTSFQPNNPPAAPRAARDPAYIEIGNWEPGTTVELIDLSEKPTASFDSTADIIKLKPTGRDINGRIASVYLTNKEMEKHQLQSGDRFKLRVVDSDGNASAAVDGTLQGNNYGQRGRALMKNAWVPASRMPLLDGEGGRKQFILRHIADTTAPTAKYFEKEAKLETGENGHVCLTSKGTLEPGARVQVQNGSTGKVSQANIGDDQSINLNLGGITDGTSLFVTVSDAAGNAAQPFELRYASNCKTGRGATLGILGAKLKGVIKPPAA